MKKLLTITASLAMAACITCNTIQFPQIIGMKKNTIAEQALEIDDVKINDIYSNVDLTSLKDKGTYRLYQYAGEVYALVEDGTIYSYNEECSSFIKKAKLRSNRYDDIVFYEGSFYYVCLENPTMKVDGRTGEVVSVIPATFKVISLSTDNYSEGMLYSTGELGVSLDLSYNDDGIVIVESKKNENGCDVKLFKNSGQYVETFSLNVAGYKQEKITTSLDNLGNLYVTVTSELGFVHNELYRINIESGECELVFTAPKIGSLLSDGETTYVSYADEVFSETGYNRESSYVLAIDKNGTLVNKLTLVSEDVKDVTIELMKSAYAAAKEQGYVVANDTLNIIDIQGDDLIVSFESCVISGFDGIDISKGKIVKIDKNTLEIK